MNDKIIEADRVESDYIKITNKILKMHKDGCNSMQIAATTGTTIQQVRKVLKKYEYMKYRPYARKAAADA